MIDGVMATMVNGYAAEVWSLERDECQRVLAVALDVALDEVGDRLRLISGIYTDNIIHWKQRNWRGMPSWKGQVGC